MDLLSNLMHNSDTNRVLICAGCKFILAVLAESSSNKEGKLSVGCLRALGNLAYVPENVRKLVKSGIVSSIVAAMTACPDDETVLQMGAAVLSNIASEPRVSTQMIEEGVLTVILHTSQAHPDLIELQKSCLGCMGNIANNSTNCYTMIDQGCGRRILEIVDKLYFDDSIIRLSLSLLKILCLSPEVSTQMTRQGAVETIVRILKGNSRNTEVVRLCSQAL